MRVEKVNKTAKMKIIGYLNRILGIKVMFYLKTFVSIIINPKRKIELLRFLGECYTQDMTSNYDRKSWRHGFRKLLLSANEERYGDMIYHFYHDDIAQQKLADENDASKVTVVCAVKNDLLRIEKFLEHYKKLGIKKFLFVDNGSDDGTFEFLKNQPEVELYSTNASYDSRAKTAWINRIIAYHGLNQWYLVVDSDEFFYYPEMDELDLNQYVTKLMQKKIFSVKAIMIEPYPKSNLMSDDLKAESFLSDYCYFDGDSDSYFYDADLGIYGGGIHERIFGLDKYSRTKVPLVYYTDERFEVGSHDIYPLSETIGSQLGAVLMHYKFLPGEGGKIKKIIQEGNYANGSRIYKRYDDLLQDGKLCAYYEGSRKWIGAASFKELPFVKRCTE